jgi:hypothetical protein
MYEEGMYMYNGMLSASIVHRVHTLIHLFPRLGSEQVFNCLFDSDSGVSGVDFSIFDSSTKRSLVEAIDSRVGVTVSSNLNSANGGGPKVTAVL